MPPPPQVNFEGRPMTGGSIPHVPRHRTLSPGRPNLRRHPRAISLQPDYRYSPHRQAPVSSSAAQPSPTRSRRRTSHTPRRSSTAVPTPLNPPSRRHRASASPIRPLAPLPHIPTLLLPENRPTGAPMPHWNPYSWAPPPRLPPPIYRDPRWHSQPVVPIAGTGLHTPAATPPVGIPTSVPTWFSPPPPSPPPRTPAPRKATVHVDPSTGEPASVHMVFSPREAEAHFPGVLPSSSSRRSHANLGPSPNASLSELFTPDRYRKFPLSSVFSPPTPPLTPTDSDDECGDVHIYPHPDTPADVRAELFPMGRATYRIPPRVSSSLSSSSSDRSSPVIPPVVPVPVLPTPSPSPPPSTAPGAYVWRPHPNPHPSYSPRTFWGPHVRARAPAPLTPRAAHALSGGYPLPGTQVGWTPSAVQWPPLAAGPSPALLLAPWIIPNPNTAGKPHIVWDVSLPPSTARRITGHDVFVDMYDVLWHPAVLPGARKMVIVCDTGMARGSLWSPIVIRQRTDLTCGDVFQAVYNFFQTQITDRELESITAAGHYEALLTAAHARCQTSPGLAEYNRLQGFKRVDCLGEWKMWWGTWIQYEHDGTWTLHLGLKAPAPF
ncbi:hypothetical protein FA95DRAFT_631145 [Auriscalpium vulgare]|uniref:Uncharacterized protein n=1 Tax=Auriscalpium vulgare TaxID=40419 RepID=A0ACB8RD78_9AGAM|nr:hypothetical protein FA95DRAFT_631145 [Auriscalpium vulgare]